MAKKGNGIVSIFTGFNAMKVYLLFISWAILYAAAQGNTVMIYWSVVFGAIVAIMLVTIGFVFSLFQKNNWGRPRFVRSRHG